MQLLKTILKTLDKNKIGYRDDGDNLILDTCPFCGKDHKLYIKKETGVWICWSKTCPTRQGEVDHQHWSKFEKLLSGEVEQEVEELPSDLQTMIDRLPESEAALAYLSSKGLSLETAKYFNLGVNSRGDLVFPHIEKGKVTRLKIRNLKYEEEIANYVQETENSTEEELAAKGLRKPTKWYGKGKDTLYHSDYLDEPVPWTVLLEGMTDTLTAYEMGLEYFSGCPSASFKQDAWIDKLQNAEAVYICMDNDPAGQLHARELAERIGLEKCYNIKLPCNDLNDLWTGFENPVEVFQQCLDEAELFEVDMAYASSVFKDRIVSRRMAYDEDGMLGFRCGYDQLDERLKGWRTGEMTLFAGKPKRGKTTFLKVLAYQVAELGTPVYYMSFETIVEQLVEDLVMYKTGKAADELDIEEFAKQVDELDSVPLYWYFPEGQKKLDSMGALETKFKQVKQRFGVKLFILDNLAKLSNNIGDRYKKTLENQESILMTLDDIAKRLDIHLIVVHHFSKEEMKSEKDDKLPTMNNLKGSMEMQYTPDNIMLFHRRKAEGLPESVTKHATVVVDAVRHVGTTGLAKFVYDPELKYYREI